MVCKHMAYHINDSDPGHTCLEQQLKKNVKVTFASFSEKGKEKKKEQEKQKDNCKAFCVTCRRNKQHWRIGVFNAYRQ